MVVNKLNGRKEITVKKPIYIDIDGTLLCGSLDKEFNDRGRDKEWYAKQYVDDLPINYRLVHILKKLKKRGHKLILWTNRGKAKYTMTKINLIDIWYLFDEHQFYDGFKHGTNIDGYTFDNEYKYLNYSLDILIYFITK